MHAVYTTLSVHFCFGNKKKLTNICIYSFKQNLDVTKTTSDDCEPQLLATGKEIHKPIVRFQETNEPAVCIEKIHEPTKSAQELL